MSLTTHTLTLTTLEPDNVTPIEGKWRVWLETADGIAVNDLGAMLGGSDEEPTTSGVAAFDLPDTDQAGFEPQGAYYKASFVSTDRRVRVKSQPFKMDADKQTDDIFAVTDLPVTPSTLLQAIAAQVAAEAARDESEAIRDEIAAIVATPGPQGPKGDTGATGAQGPAGSDATVTAAAVASVVQTGTAKTTLDAAYTDYKRLARNPDMLIAGAITRDANGAATSAPVTWPDGSPGTYTATSVSTAFPGAVDAYTITYGSPVTKTYSQPAITRDPTTGAATNVPAVTVA